MSKPKSKPTILIDINVLDALYRNRVLSPESFGIFVFHVMDFALLLHERLGGISVKFNSINDRIIAEFKWSGEYTLPTLRQFSDNSIECLSVGISQKPQCDPYYHWNNPKQIQILMKKHFEFEIKEAINRKIDELNKLTSLADRKVLNTWC